jgi:hypothetical protein
VWWSTAEEAVIDWPMTLAQALINAALNDDSFDVDNAIGSCVNWTNGWARTGAIVEQMPWRAAFRTAA